MADDTLSYLFELDAKINGADTALGQLDKMGKKSDEVLKKHHEGFKGIGETVDGVKGKFHEFFSFVGAEIALEGLKKIGETVVDIGHEILEAAGGAERMGLSFELMVGDEGAKGLLEWIDRIAAKTEFTDDQLKGWGLDLLNAGVKADKLDQFMAAGLDLAARSKDKVAGMAGAIQALAKVNLTGRIEQRSLIPLNIGPKDLRGLEQFKGMSDDAIRKAMETGTVTKDQLLDVIAGSDKMLGDAGVKAGKTLGALMKNLRSLPEQFFQKISDTPAFGRFKETIDGIFKQLNPDTRIGKQIFKLITDGFETVSNVLSKVDFAAKIDLFTRAIRGLADVAGPVLKFLFHRFEEFAFLLAKVTGHIKSPEDQHKDALAELDLEMELQHFKTRKEFSSFPADVVANDHAKALLEIKNQFTSPQAFEDAVDRMRMIGGDLADGLMDGMKAGAAGVADASGKLAETAVAASSKALDAHSPSRVFEKLGASTGDGFVIGVESRRPAVDESLAAFAVPASGGAGAGGGVQVSIGEIVVQVMSAGDDPDQQGHAVAAAAVDAIRSGILRAFEELAAQQGA